MNNENCRLCGLQSLEVLSEKSTDSLNITENYPCYIKIVIEYLHEKILGCQENDESTKPTAVSSSLGNAFFESQHFQILKKQHNCLIKMFTDTAYNTKPLDEFKPVNSVNFELINTREKLNAMLDDLLKFDEISVNLEYYSIRSYLGFTWLLQISTTKTNYFVNCLKLETELHVLNEVFMNMNILKIFYNGKDSVLWLQKDFGILVANMFDVCGIQKCLQTAQEIELIDNSAFSFIDPKHTYLLLFIKTYITNLLFKLGKANILTNARQKCNKTCAQVYKKPEWNDINVLKKLSSTRASVREIHVIRELLIWRDKTAKIEDVSLNVILPDNTILKCANGLLKTVSSGTFNKYCNPEFSENRKVELNLNEIIKTAKQSSTKKLSIVRRLSTKVSETSLGLTVDYKKLGQKLNKTTESPPIKIKIKKSKYFYLLKMLKPQLGFQDKIDNSFDIWMPGIVEKPNRLIPLHLHIVRRGSKARYCHPYKTELVHFRVPRNQLVENTPMPTRKIEKTPLYVIKKLKELMRLSSKLQDYSEIAVDLKYNKKRSYFGYTSLLLISTRDTDYIIDALLLRSHLHILNKIFTDPKILKVFHNSVNKITWLQKDFSLYVVNMFDVARTNMLLNKKILKLVYLKQYICDIKPKELSQIELPEEEKDWRVKSLPFNVKQYLRYDTHYLLYIKDILSNKLCNTITGDLLKRYYDYCTSLCKNVYQKPSFNINCYKDILNKKHVKNKYAGHIIRIKVMKELNRLRHEIARKEDENPNDILSEKVLLKLVDSLSHDQQKILNVWNYDKKKIYVSKVTNIIFSAKHIQIKNENDDDYHYTYELNNDVNEMTKCELDDKNRSKYDKRRCIITIGDFICFDKANKTTTNRNRYKAMNARYTNNVSDRSFILIKGDRWNERRNIGDWLKKWIGKIWSGNYRLRQVNDAVLVVNLSMKRYRDIIWNKRNLIYYEDGAFIHNLLSYEDRQRQRNLTNIAKDLRSIGLQVKIRELAIKIEDIWYEWKLEADGLHELSAEEIRMRGVDTDL